MAELNTAESGSKKKHGGKTRSKKLSTKVDLTPMVDLAFLLITFFMLTTTLNKPNAMELAMPKKEKKEPAKVDENIILNVILDKDDAVWYYSGKYASGLEKTTFSNSGGIRDIIYKTQNKIKSTYGTKDTMVCLIKMAEGSKYKNMVDILDEMDVTGIKRYAIQDILPLEIEAIENGGNAKVNPNQQ